MSKPRVIAFYLPQYHPTPDNDKWWGKGFTEWTNVGKAKPLFPGHYQPKVPADLGYYDLRLPEVREAQAELAKEAGIYGFCYYHYWFGSGKEELELPFNEVLRLGKPDFPFMLCWANESWHKKFWNKDGVGSSKEMLIEQTYPGEEDIERHFYHLLPAFKDKRYIKIDGKPAFMIYKFGNLPEQEKFINIWQTLARENGLGGIFLLSQINSDKNTLSIVEEYTNKGIDAVNVVRLYEGAFSYNNRSLFNRIRSKIKRTIFKQPYRVDYNKVLHLIVSEEDKKNNVYPTIFPNWDHTPRSIYNGLVYENTSPSSFRRAVKLTLSIIASKPQRDQIIFLKSWNEWGEGNYMEPDLKYGKGFITALKEAIQESEI